MYFLTNRSKYVLFLQAAPLTMLNMSAKYLFIFISNAILIITCGCGSQNTVEHTTQNPIAKPIVDTSNVSIDNVKRTTFANQVWSNGIIEARQKTIVAFPTQGTIVGLFIQNGQKVTAGQVLAQLDNSLINAQNEKDLAQLAIIEGIRNYWLLFYEMRHLCLYDFVNQQKIKYAVSEN